jgi:hypothetical protein
MRMTQSGHDWKVREYTARGVKGPVGLALGLSPLLGLRFGLVVHDVFGDQVCEVDRPVVPALVETTN